MKNLVSVICLTYNQKEYIKNALDSILSQKAEIEFEIIVHDDASDDGTVEILREYQNKYPQIIRLILEEKNLFSQEIDFFYSIVTDCAKGEYIAICEGDDYWISDEKLQIQYDALRNHMECDMCACRAVMVSEDKKIVLGEVRPKTEDAKLTMDEVITGGGMFLATAGLFFRRSLFNYKMEFEKIRSLDYSHQMKGAIRGGIYYIDRPLVAYRRYSQGSVTSDITKNEKRMRHQCEQEKLMLKTLDKETNGMFHDAIIHRLKAYETSAYDQLEQNYVEIKEILDKYAGMKYIWGYGVRGKQLERFCKDYEIKIDGVCDVLNQNIGAQTVCGNQIYKTDVVLDSNAIILCSTTDAYKWLNDNGYNSKNIDMQRYMPIL